MCIWGGRGGEQEAVSRGRALVADSCGIVTFSLNSPPIPLHSRPPSSCSPPGPPGGGRAVQLLPADVHRTIRVPHVCGGVQALGRDLDHEAHRGRAGQGHLPLQQAVTGAGCSGQRGEGRRARAGVRASISVVGGGACSTCSSQGALHITVTSTPSLPPACLPALLPPSLSRSATGGGTTPGAPTRARRLRRRTSPSGTSTGLTSWAARSSTCASTRWSPRTPRSGSTCTGVCGGGGEGEWQGKREGRGKARGGRNFGSGSYARALP